MGIARAMIKLLMREGNRQKLEGTVLTAGRQDVYATATSLRQWAREMEFELVPDIDVELSGNPEFRNRGYISDKTLFLSLGFDKVDSIDYSGYEQCTIVHDLNIDVPAQYHNKYDLVFDGGTSEHIFNFPKVLENFNRMTKVGGRVIHASPSSNHVDHGLYMFSPTLFLDYYSANKWEIVENLFFQYVPSSGIPRYKSGLWNIYSYVPGSLYTWIFGGYKGMYGIVSINKKSPCSTFDATVYQGLFLRSLSESRRAERTTSETEALVQNMTFLQKAIFKRTLSPKMKNLIRPLYFRIAARLPLKYHLKLVARY